MRTRLIVSAFAALFMLAGAQQAAALSITPADAYATTNDNSNCEPGCIPGLPAGSTLYYKTNGAEEGSFAGSYTSDIGDSGGTITYDGLPDPSITCPECFMVVKDGAATPAQYFFNLGDLGWDGTEQLVLSGFWVGTTGSISHVSIWGVPTTTTDTTTTDGSTVPEPAALLLLASGLAVAGRRLRRTIA